MTPNDDKGFKDRNFDPIAEHFVQKVYGGLKGDIRLAVLRRDLKTLVSELSTQLQRPLRVLDVGAGLAQLSLELAQSGHEVTINDISQSMITKAQASAQEAGLLNPNATPNITWHICPYQHLEAVLVGKYDVILCHALLEWLDNPHNILPFFKRWLMPSGKLSLCFYNPASFVYRNLIMGNFNLLNNPDYKADNKKSLTPNNPVAYDEVVAWLTKIEFKVQQVSGLRVFHDYSPLKRGGHTNADAVIEMEVRYSRQTPYKWLGRYLHVIAAPLHITD